jgi:indole-3-acetate monooxygenase
MRTGTKTVSSETIFNVDLLETARNIAPTLSQYVKEEESNRRPSRQVLDALREAGFFRLFLPKSLGGVEADPLTAAKVVGEVAMHNTTAGWSMMVANTSTWWCSRLSDRGIDELYKNGPDTFIAGAFHPPMKATPVENGYLLNGRSPLASNVHEAEWIFVTAFVMEQGEMKTSNGVPEIIGVFMRSEHCQIIDTWHTVGMRATDSNDVAANDVFVPAQLSYPLVPSFQPNRHYKGSLYQFPAIGASIGSLIVPIALAVARNAISELKIMADKKIPFGSTVSIRDKGTVQKKLGNAEAFVQSGHAYLYHVLSACWKKTLDREKLSLNERAELLLAIAHTNQTSLQAVDLMYSAAGTSAIYTRNKLAGYFCDAQVIRHHGFANESRYETAAQVYFGLPPDLPVILF